MAFPFPAPSLVDPRLVERASIVAQNRADRLAMLPEAHRATAQRCYTAEDEMYEAHRLAGICDGHEDAASDARADSYRAEAERLRAEIAALWKTISP